MKNVKIIVLENTPLCSMTHQKAKIIEAWSMNNINFQSISFLKNGIKSGLIFYFVLIFNSILASNYGKEISRNTDLIPKEATQIPDLDLAGISNPITNFQVPFILLHNLIVIEAVVGGKKGNVLLDTGTDQLIINEKHFRGREGSSYISGINGDMIRPERKQVSLQIGPIPVHSQNAYVSDLSHLEGALHMDILGVCGVDFLQRYQWVIHYHKRFIEFYSLDKSGEVLAPDYFMLPTEILELEKEGSHLSLSAEVGGLTLNLALDSGTSGIVLSQKMNKSGKMANPYLRKLQHETTSVGITTSKNAIHAYGIYELQVGNTEVPPMQVNFLSFRGINKVRYRQLDGVFNPLFLCHGTIGINWKKQELTIWEDAPGPMNNTHKDKNWLVSNERTGRYQ